MPRQDRHTIRPNRAQRRRLAQAQRKRTQQEEARRNPKAA